MDARGLPCLKCKQSRPSWMMHQCPICAGAICEKCSVAAYGRIFCTSKCAEYFFYGDSEDEDRPADG